MESRGLVLILWVAVGSGRGFLEVGEARGRSSSWWSLLRGKLRAGCDAMMLDPRTPKEISPNLLAATNSTAIAARCWLQVHVSLHDLSVSLGETTQP